ncbi:hypothetical protein M513_05138 [Trichuris suis]|uniref:Uncharacterized protein n=1 Tax=Trichuris suis TaxID=68888 RepID=A0A085M9H5_9BILA|nr:hypothetical protein M513_05138 [Trichuris suis]
MIEDSMLCNGPGGLRVVWSCQVLTVRQAARNRQHVRMPNYINEISFIRRRKKKKNEDRLKKNKKDSTSRKVE